MNVLGGSGAEAPVQIAGSGRPVAAATTGRLLALDGLRGIAATSVVFFHFHDSGIRPGLERVLPRAVIWLMQHGMLGVQVFFVLSGFVIAHSTWGQPITRNYALRFALRRQIRLDPLYWVVLGMALVDVWLPHLRHPGRPGNVPLPSTGYVLAHFAYLQQLLYDKSMVPVFWTLCIEVQFYVVFILLLWAGHRLVRRWPHRPLLTILPTAVLALPAVYWFPAQAGGTAALFLRDWYMFAVGVLACWVARERAPVGALGIVSGVLIVVGIVLLRPEPAVAGVTALTLVAASRRPELGKWLARPTLLYLGRISYSLYLVHYVVGSRVINAGCSITGGTSGRAALLWGTAAIAASIVAAHLLHLAVERPTLRLAARLKSPSA